MSIALIAALGMTSEASSVIRHGPPDRHWVALTFDDGWNATRCEQITRTLRAKRATATFLVNGSVMRSAPARWRRVLKGFPVANHTLTHPWLTRLSTSQIRSQIRTNERLIEGVLDRPMLRLLRPPFGAWDIRVVGVADALGYRTIMWSVDAGDTLAGATSSRVVREATRGGNGAIVLLHCGPAVTPPAIGAIVDSYRGRGYKLVDLGKMLGLTPPARACRVRNLDTGVTKTSLRMAARAASPGQRLSVRGTCRGTNTLRRDLTIRGVRSATSGPPTLAGMDRGTVVTVLPGITVKIVDLTIRGGSEEQAGGIRNLGSLTLADVTARGNEAGRAAGGILNRGELTLNGSSSVRGNTAGSHGGGIVNSGSLSVSDSATVSHNTAASWGGGIVNSGSLWGVTCGGNVHGNAPDDCAEG